MCICIRYLLIVILIKNISVDGNSDSLNVCAKPTESDVAEYTDKKIQICGCEEGGRCIRKCCKLGYYHYHDESSTGYYESVCYKTVDINFNIPIYNVKTYISDESENFRIGMLSCDDGGPQYILQNNSESETFFVQENGSLYYPYFEYTYDTDNYCIDEYHGYAAHICFNNPMPKPQQREAFIHMLAKLIPVPFLLVTWLVYAFLSDRTLHRYAFMNHVLTLIPANLILGTGQYWTNTNYALCSLEGYVILFCMVSSFFWINVMCIDIWLEFSKFKGFTNEKTKKKAFTLATVYSFGVPALEVLLVVLFNSFIEVVDEDEAPFYYPAIGRNSCFLYKVWPSIIYYFGPILLLVKVNIVLFVMTIININGMKKDINVGQNFLFRKNRETKFRLYWKLLFVMGLNPVVNTHVVQLMAWMVNKHSPMASYIHYFKDVSHISYGIFIFIVFVCQKKTLLSLSKRCPFAVKLAKFNSDSSLDRNSAYT